MSDNMTEKRKFERFDVNVPVRLKVISQEGRKEEYEFETCNLSAEGIYVFGQTLQEGLHVKVEIFLSFIELKNAVDPKGTLVIRTTGRVLRSDPDGTAIQLNEDYDFMTRLYSIQKKQ
jgi:hypothetical protein